MVIREWPMYIGHRHQLRKLVCWYHSSSDIDLVCRIECSLQAWVLTMAWSLKSCNWRASGLCRFDKHSRLAAQWLLVVGECFIFYCEAMTACHVIPSLSFPLLYAAVSDTLQCHLVSHSHTVNTRRTGEDNHVIPASRGSAPSNRIWNNTTLCFLKQQIWLITTLCGGWCRCMMLRNLRVACQKWQRRCQ